MKIKTVSILKAFPYLLLVYSIIPLITAYGFLTRPDLIQKYNIDASIEILYQLLILLYCLIGGFGLLKKKKWALYLVAIPGTLIFFDACFDLLAYMMFFQNGSIYELNFFILFVKTFLGIFSIVLYGNKNLFLNTKKDI